jgi:RNA polymerase sigma factor (sigma-70 family)
MTPSPLRHPARMAGASLLRLQSDERLAELAIAGHEAAFDAIVDRYRTPLMRHCAGIVGPSRAEDAVQQALINAHDALQRTAEVRHLRSWLYRIAHNAALNVLRAVRDDAPLEADAHAAPASDTPAERFERSEQFSATLAALQALPERQRAALVLRELEGRSHEEIAEALGVTKGSARQHLMRARVAVRSAVTAVTPYPLIARLAELTAGGSAPGWVDGAATASAGAGLAKLTAGLAATGALVGGAVGTQHVVGHGSGRASDEATAAPRVEEPSVRRASSAPAAGAGRGAAATGTGTGTGTVRVTRASSTPAAVTTPRAGPKPTSRAKSKSAPRRKTATPTRSHTTSASLPHQTTTEAAPSSSAPAKKHDNKGKAKGKDKGKGKSKGNSDKPTTTPAPSKKDNKSKGNTQKNKQPTPSEPATTAPTEPTATTAPSAESNGKAKGKDKGNGKDKDAED